MEVKVVLRGGSDVGGVGEGRGRRDHQEGEGLGPRRGERFLLAMGDVVRLDALDGVEELWILALGSESRLERGAAERPTCCCPDMLSVVGCPRLRGKRRVAG